MKTLFFGTPELAVPFLQLVAQKSALLGVVTKPDEPAGRHYELQKPPVKVAAEKLNLPVLQPDDLKNPEFLSKLQSLAPEVAVIVAYGKILPSALLKVPTQGYLNVHFSLLPAYRGAAPIQRALMQGEKRTGVTIFWLDEGMDSGPIFLQKELPIAEDDDADTLREKLIPLGRELLQEVLERLQKGQISRQPQSGPVSLAHSLKKDEGKIDWNQSAQSIVNLVRGTTPWPGAYTLLTAGDKVHRLKILKARSSPQPFPEVGEGGPSPFSGEGGRRPEEGVPGTIVHLDKGHGFVVKCGREFLQINRVQPEGKRPMSAWEFWLGARSKLGDKLG